MRKRKLRGMLAGSALALAVTAVAATVLMAGCDNEDPDPKTSSQPTPPRPQASDLTPTTAVVAPVDVPKPGSSVPDNDRFQDVVGPVTPDRNVAKVIQTLPVFNRPVSTVVSADRRFLFVSNSALTTFGTLYYKGAISKLEIQPDGRLKMLQQKFVDNVHAPAGMATLTKATRKFPAGALFVCTGATSGCDDKNERITDVKKFNPGVSVFDPDSGKLLGFIPMGPGRAVAKSIYRNHAVLTPAGICFDPNGNLYVTDTSNTGKELEPAIYSRPGILRIKHQHIDNYADDKDSGDVAFIPVPHEPGSIYYSKADDCLYWCTCDGKTLGGGAVYRMPPEVFPQQNMVQPIFGGENVGALMGATITPKGTLITSRLDGELAIVGKQVIDRVRFFEEGSFSSPAEIKLHTLRDGYNVVYVPEQEPNATELWKQRLRVILLPTKL